MRYEDTLPAQERFEAIVAREAEPAADVDDRPSRAELAEDARWPRCRTCGKTAMPELRCSEDRCPFHRVEGRIVR